LSVERDPIFGCELATGRRDRDGYAFHGTTRAHIAAWVKANGPVPPGLELDHLCRVRHCCAVHHLEPITRSEQERRKSWRYRSRMKQCPRGHDLATNGIVTPEGGRVCRACNRAAESKDTWAT
jgi:hypothetical protein